jgi:hypothetical protein
MILKCSYQKQILKQNQLNTFSNKKNSFKKYFKPQFKTPFKERRAMSAKSEC